MALQSLFSEETLSELFKNYLKLDKQNVKYSIEQCSRNEHILYLKIDPDNGDLKKEYAMVKMSTTDEVGKKKMELAKTLGNIWTVQDDNKNVYLVFSKKDTVFPTKNNLDNLNTILKNLAQFQTTYLSKMKIEATINKGYQVKSVSDHVLSLEFFKDLDKVYVSDTISRLQEAVDDLYQDDLLVKSMGSMFANDAFTTASNKYVFWDSGHDVVRPPVFDALIYIFALSDEKFRQHHLKTLLTVYYQTFIELAEKIDNKILINFDLNAFERHVKILLPVVKFQTAVHLMQKASHGRAVLDELLNNIMYSLKYQEVSYEDCLEAISRKLGSTEFDLLNYQLINLDQKNGHHGQYFSLKANVIFSGKSEELDMFTKVLRTGNSHMNDIVQSGASKKEQFFFRTLVPLFKQYGLESLVDFAPNCYFDRLNDVIILDDLARLGYKSFKTDAKLGYDVLKSAFLMAAKLHACTLILEDRMSKSEGAVVRLGDMYKEFMEDWIFPTREGLPRSPSSGEDAKPGLDQMIDSFVDVPKELSNEEFHKRVDAIYEVFMERLNSPAKQFRNVVCHGDLWASNVLTKHDKNGNVEDSFVVDFQGLRYVPIAADLLMLVYCSANKEVRDEYLDTLLDEYYQELKKIMSQFDLDVNEFYTPEEFAECVKYMKPVIIIATAFYSQLIAVSAERREEIFFDESKFTYYLIENRKEYVKYILSFSDDSTKYLKGLIEDLYDVCVTYDF